MDAAVTALTKSVGVFEDSERHPGHVIRTAQWHAYDATHLNFQEDGIRYLGDFSDLESATAAVETSVASQRASASMSSRIF
jgi:hypothetical protein